MRPRCPLTVLLPPGIRPCCSTSCRLVTIGASLRSVQGDRTGCFWSTRRLCGPSGSVIFCKVVVVQLQLRGESFVYSTRAFQSYLGPFPYTASGLCMVGIPMVMGEKPKAALDRALKKLRLVSASIRHLRASHVLVLRVVLCFAVSSLDYVAEVVPLPEAVVLHHQWLVKRICSMALGIPCRAPYAVLCDCVHCLGLGVPRLGHRFPCRYIKGILLALNSRSSVTRNTLRSLILGPSCGGVS